MRIELSKRELLGGDAYRAKVLYIDQRDSSRSLLFQLDLLESLGFSMYETLLRSSVFACYLA